MSKHDFKVGDQVLIDDNRFGSQRPMKLATVERVTATQFVAGGIRFKGFLDSGQEIGGHDWHPIIARRATPELVAKNNAKTARHNAEKALRLISDVLRKLEGDEAVAMLAKLPEELRNLGAKT